MEMPGRKYNPQGYRYGFNGKENDRSGEWGLGLVQDYGARIYSPGLGRWLSTDPLEAKAPAWTPYRSFFCNPILYMDIDGQFELPTEIQRNYPMFTLYISKYVEMDVMKSSVILNAFYKNTAVDNPNRVGNLTEDKVRVAVKWNSGPMIILSMNGASGFYNASTGQIELNKGNLDALEKILSSDASHDVKLNALSAVYMTLLHETTHYGDYLDGIRQDGGEPGVDFEYDVWQGKTVEVDGEKFTVRYVTGAKNSDDIQMIMDEKMKTEEGRKTFPTVPVKEVTPISPNKKTTPITPDKKTTRKK
jgi:RHS repeat-associated protein